MSQTVIQIDPMTTSAVLKNLSLAIDEIKLVRSIDALNEQVKQAQEMQPLLSRKRYLDSEMRFLNKRLKAVREKAEAG